MRPARAKTGPDTRARVTADVARQAGAPTPDSRLGPRAYQHIKESLLNGDYPCGARLNVESIAVELGTSRQPVMEAIRRLETEGFVEIRPQVGCRVVDPARSDVLDFFRLLAASEGTFAELAAVRGTQQEIEALQAIHSASGLDRKAGMSKERIALAYRIHNREFHKHIHAMARAPLIHPFGTSLWDKSDFLINSSVGVKSFALRAFDAVQEHGRLCEAIAAHDAARARMEMERHILAFAKGVG